jgi:hypothetical protein
LRTQIGERRCVGRKLTLGLIQCHLVLLDDGRPVLKILIGATALNNALTQRSDVSKD